MLQHYPRQKVVWEAVLLILVAAALYTPYLDRPMEYDESYTFFHYSINPAYALLSYVNPNNHLLHSLGVWAAKNTIGTAPIGIRMTAFSAALLAIAMLYRVGRQYYGHLVGITATCFLISSLWFANYAVNGRGYTLNIFLSLALMAQMQFVQRYYRLKRIHTYGLLLNSAALMMVLPSSAILISSNILWIFWKFKAQIKRAIRATAPLITGAIIGTLFYLPSIGNADEQLNQFGLKPDQLIVEFVQLSSNTPGLGPTLLLSAIAGCFLAYSSARSSWQYHIFIVLTALLLIPVQYAILGKVFFGRNYIYLLTLLTMWGGLTITSIFQRYTYPIIISIFIVSSIIFRRLDDERDSLELATLVEKNVAGHEAVIIGCCLNEPTWYYLVKRGKLDLLTTEPGTQTVYVVETRFDSYSMLLQEYALDKYVDVCEITSGWEPYNVYRCILEDY